MTGCEFILTRAVRRGEDTERRSGITHKETSEKMRVRTEENAGTAMLELSLSVNGTLVALDGGDGAHISTISLLDCLLD